MIYGITYAHIIYTLVLIVLGFLVSYYKANAKFRSFIATLVNDAESLGATGAEKKAWVVNQIYTVLPIWLKPILTKTILSMIVQSVFDSMKQYATKLMNAAVISGADAIRNSKSTTDSTETPVKDSEAVKSAS